MPDPWTKPFEAHRERLFQVAYRMLGQVQAAEDAAQDAYLRWRSVDPKTVDNPGAYLTTIVTRLCLDELSSARVERESYTGPWLPEPVVDPLDRPDQGDLDRSGGSSVGLRPDRSAEQSDAASMAMLVVLETLPPRQRAVFVLREAFDLPYADIAPMIEESESYCRKLAQRARNRIDERDVVSDARPSEQHRIIRDLMTAIEDGDAEAVANTLAEDAVVKSDGGGKVTAARRPVEGREHITRFFLGIAEQVPDDFALEYVMVNGQPGVLATVEGQVQSVWGFHVRDGRIQSAYAVLNPEKLRHVDPDRFAPES